MNERLLANPDERSIKQCPKCKKFNIANPDIDSTNPNLSYHIPLVSRHKFYTATIEPLCQPCVDKIHKEIDGIMRAKIPTHTATCNHYSHATNAEPSYSEFEIMVDGITVYRGYDVKEIKYAMATKVKKPDKFATPWLNVADIKTTGYEAVLIDNKPYKIVHRDIRKPLVSKIIKGYIAQAKEYVVALNSDRTYTVAVGV